MGVESRIKKARRLLRSGQKHVNLELEKLHLTRKQLFRQMQLVGLLPKTQPAPTPATARKLLF